MHHYGQEYKISCEMDNSGINMSVVLYQSKYNYSTVCDEIDSNVIITKIMHYKSAKINIRIHIYKFHMRNYFINMTMYLHINACYLTLLQVQAHSSTCT